MQVQCELVEPGDEEWRRLRAGRSEGQRERDLGGDKMDVLDIRNS
jgi:hypothetical protein